MVRLVRAECCDRLWLQWVACLRELLENTAQLKDIVENQTVGDQMVVLDDLALLLSIIGGDHPLAAKRQPLRKPTKRLTLIGCRMDGSA